MISVLLLCRYDRLGASSRLRFLDFIEPLAGRGIDVVAAPLMSDAYLRAVYGGRRPSFRGLLSAYVERVARLLERRRFDVVWLEKEALPWLPASVEERLLGGVPYVMDLDDAWYLRYEEHRSSAVRRALGGKFARLARGARVVTAGNPHLAAWARGCGAVRVEVVPTVVDVTRYGVEPPPARSRPVVGWMGSPSSAKYLDTIAGSLARLGERARIRVVGEGGAASLVGVSVERADWSEEGEAAALTGFDIGVMPLVDGPWERGKCGYKLIQYMAAGRPVVASPVGVNTMLVRDGVNGFLAEDGDAWIRALDTLISDADLRVEMGRRGRLLVEREYSREAVAPRLEEILRRAAG